MGAGPKRTGWEIAGATLRFTGKLGILAVAAITLRAGAACAQPASPAKITLFVNPQTHAVFTEPGKGRILLGTFSQTKSTEEVGQRMTQRNQAALLEEQSALRAEFATRMNQQREWNNEMAKQVSEMQPAWRDFGDTWYKKISIGTLIYGDWGMWTHTGWGPQFNENLYTPGPGNQTYNSFDITRAYLDTRFTPNEDLSARVTPELYRQISTAQPDKFGRLSAINTNLDGQEGVRIKYAYVDYKTLFKKVLPVAPAKDDVVTFGIQQNPFSAWQDNLWGYRYLTLNPWNFVGYGSTATGLRFSGPIKFHEKQYLDYEAGVFDDGNGRQYDLSSEKQVAARVSYYPFGARSQYQGLGITGFVDYGYPNSYAPDRTLTAAGLPLAGNASANGHITRTSVLVSYQADTWQLAGEWDYGHNAFTAGNYFNGAGPVDAFSTSFTPSGVTCKPVTSTPSTPSCSLTYPNSPYSSFAKMVSVYQNSSTSVQQGLDFFGHYDIPGTPFDVFGMFQDFEPNTQVAKNPLDFQRWLGGIEWKINKNLRVALDSQNMLYYHSQFDVSSADLEQFTTFGKKNPAFSVRDAVPTDVHAFFLNLEFRY